ncbi:hypothetical protein AAU57_13210 [Nonlabens sp. YIK11]|nr:hypothetical protein AAU57_13210 [Nonlabens sp. YIK11]
MDKEELQGLIVENINQETFKKLKGTIKLQIIAYKDNTSCLLSYENKTNKTASEIGIADLEQFIKNDLVWNRVTENAAVLVELKFKKGRVNSRRMGMSGKKGWHELDLN